MFRRPAATRRRINFHVTDVDHQAFLSTGQGEAPKEDNEPPELEEDQSLEVLLVQGPPQRLQQLCDDLRRVRGVQQIKLVTTTALLPPLHAHGEADEAARKAAS